MSQPESKPTITKTPGGINLSFKISEMNMEQLEQLAQGLLIQHEKLREQRIYVRKAMDTLIDKARRDGINKEIARLEAIRDGVAMPDAPGVVHGEAPGAIIEVQASNPVEQKPGE